MPLSCLLFVRPAAVSGVSAVKEEEEEEEDSEEKEEENTATPCFGK